MVQPLISKGRIARQLVKFQLALLAGIIGNYPIPLWYWHFCQRFLRLLSVEPNPLFPPYTLLQTKGDAVEVPQLRTILADDLLGGWALDRQTIKFIWALLWRTRPQIIFEYGSGVSTLLLTSYASLLSRQAGVPCIVISLEEDELFKLSVEERLKANKLGEFSKILQVYRDDRGIYDLRALEEVLTGGSIDLVLIDGPAGPPGCRYETLPAILPYCRAGGQWLLDDAFRDGELEILSKWRNLPKIKIQGIFALGKGLATGQVL